MRQGAQTVSAHEDVANLALSTARGEASMMREGLELIANLYCPCKIACRCMRGIAAQYLNKTLANWVRGHDAITQAATLDFAARGCDEEALLHEGKTRYALEAMAEDFREKAVRMRGRR